MSLYVGRLPSHIRPVELIRVFRKFGHCDLRLKDGYGFVIYEVIADAERALRTLRGKNICGEQISLNWSNKQPNSYKRSVRPKRIYEPYRGRKEEENEVGIKGFQDGRDFARSDPNIPAYNHGRDQGNVHDKEKGHAYEVIDDVRRERDMSLREGVIDEGNTSESNPLENDRWGEPANDDALTGNGVVNNSEFDRYEPYHGYNRRDEEGNSHMSNSYSSPDHEGSQRKGKREQSSLDKLKPQPTCYNCGQIGHIKRYCPEGDARREKFSKFSNRRDEINFRDRGDGKRKMLRTNSWGRRDASREPFIFRRHERVRKESHSENSRRLIRRTEINTEKRERSQQSKLREKSHAKKRSKEEPGTQKKVMKKRRGRRSLSSSDSSTSSSSRSQSSRSRLLRASCSTSRSPSRSLSPSSSSRSVSVSSKGSSPRSPARSRSKSGSHKSPSLSVSLEKKPQSSQRNVHQNVSPTSLKGKSEHSISPISQHPLLESSELKEGSTVVKLKVDNKLSGQYLEHDTHDARFSSHILGFKENSATMNLPKSVTTAERSHQQGALETNPKIQISVSCEGRNRMKITTKEMILALKHYGLPAPEEGESGISVEEYFGAARLWPWEIIYYRRLKKGPISTENYARRLEQNEEFGIVDKYIRSSSGWSECEQTSGE